MLFVEIQITFSVCKLAKTHRKRESEYRMESRELNSPPPITTTNLPRSTSIYRVRRARTYTHSEKRVIYYVATDDILSACACTERMRRAKKATAAAAASKLVHLTSRAHKHRETHKFSKRKCYEETCNEFSPEIKHTHTHTEKNKNK